MRLADVHDGVAEIMIRGHNVMKGYWNNPGATADAIDPDRWFHTGDLARIDDDGYFFVIVDRKKEMIIRGGFNIYPREIEEVLHEHPDVMEAAVVGLPHDELGEDVGAAVVLKPGRHADAGEIKSFVKARGRRTHVPPACVVRGIAPERSHRQDPASGDQASVARPVMPGYWERAELPLELARRLGEKHSRSAENGARTGRRRDRRDTAAPPMSTIAAGLIQMELSRGDGSLGVLLGVQAGLAMRSIATFGSEEQKQRWLPPMARMESLGAFALTEPDRGSDSVSLETTARRDGGDYVIDGAKRWIGNGSIADVVVVWARDSDDGRVKGFLVEHGTPGYNARVIEGKGSVRSVWQAEIELSAVRVPADSRLPGANSFKDTRRVLASTRLTSAFAALGHAVGSYDAALSYCRPRKQFGKPLISFQIVQERLVRMLAEVTAMQLYCLRVGRLGEQDGLRDTIAGLAKMNNTSRARHVIAEARDLLGGNGILLENNVIRHMADIEAIHRFEGTETIQTLIVGRDITGVSAFT